MILHGDKDTMCGIEVCKAKQGEKCMCFFRELIKLYTSPKSGYSRKDFWGRTVHYNKYDEIIGYTVKSFWGKRKRYDANWNLISYSVKNLWGGYNTYDPDGNLISKSYKNIFGGYTTYDKNGVKTRISYKGFWNIMKHFDLEETCVYERGNKKRITYSPKQTLAGDYVKKNEVAPKVNTTKVQQEEKITSAASIKKETEKQEISQEHHYSEEHKEYIPKSGTVVKEKDLVIPGEHKGVTVESYSKQISEGQHIDKTAEYYQSVEAYVKAEKITQYAKLLIFKYKNLEEFPAIAYLKGNMIRVEPLLCKAEPFEFAFSEIERAKEVHVTDLDMNAMDNEFLTCSMSSLGKEFEELLPEYLFGMDGMYRVQYVFDCGLVITENSVKELQKILS